MNLAGNKFSNSVSGRGRFLPWNIGTFASLASLLTAAVLFSSCSHRVPDAAKGARPGGGAPVPVLAAQATNEDVPVQIQEIGNVQAYSMVSIRSQITGPIVKVHFKEETIE